MARLRSVALPLVMALLGAGCSSSETVSTTATATTGSTVTEPVEPAPTTAWEQVLAGVADPMPLQTAIDAFSLAFGPIDGATPTDLPRGFLGSGTGPLRWLLGRWDELTDTQQSQVEAILATWDSGPQAAPAPLVVASLLPAGRMRSTLEVPQALVDDMVTNIATLLGRDLNNPITLKAAATGAEIEGNLGMAIPRDAAGGFTGPAVSCTIILAPEALALDGSELVAVAAHEVFHCFEFELGTLEQVTQRPAWIMEGMAEWAGETIAGGSGSEGSWWPAWLDDHAYRTLFARTYDALGFYAHVDDSGVEMWERVDPAILASDTSSEAAYQVLIAGGSADLVDSWGAGYFRDPANAPVWDQDGPGITLDAPTIEEGFLANESTFALAAEPYAVFASDLQVIAEVVTFESPGEGLVLMADGTTVELEDLHGVALCTTGSCMCPEGTPMAGTVFSPMTPGVISIGATGHVFGSEVTVVGWSVERFCEGERCHVGTWTSGVWNVPRVIAGGQGAPLVITREGEGYVDWSQASDILGVVQGGTTAGAEILPLKLVVSGASHFFVEPAGAGIRVTASAGSLGITPFIDLGQGWFETSGESAYNGFGKIGGEAIFACAGNTMYLNGAIQFWRVSTDAVIPAEAADLTPTTAPGGGTTTTSGVLPAVDPCTLVTLAEVQSLAPEAVAPDGPDDLPSTFFSQCTFPGGVAVQVYAVTAPDFFTDGADILDLTIVDIPGVGDWALAQINQPDPQFGIEETVLLMVASTSAGTVALVPYVDVFEGTPAYEALVALLEVAVSRL